MTNDEMAQCLCDVCETLGIPVPERPRPNFGSGLVGGSAFEHRAQDEWDARLRASLDEAHRLRLKEIYLEATRQMAGLCYAYEREGPEEIARHREDLGRALARLK